MTLQVVHYDGNRLVHFKEIRHLTVDRSAVQG